MSLRWFGGQVSANVKRAQVGGINRTMAEAAIHAKNNHEWRNRTGVLEGSIGIAEYGHSTANGAAGTWGSQDVAYAIFQEIGTPDIPARPYLRPAADATYPRLAANIRREMGP